MINTFLQDQNVHRMIAKICKMVCDKVEGDLTVVGVKTGGEYISEVFASIVRKKGRLKAHFDIELDKRTQEVVEGMDKLVANESTYIFVDDAIWTEHTKKVVEKALELKKITKYKYAVILDPYKRADFSLYS